MRLFPMRRSTTAVALFLAAIPSLHAIQAISAGAKDPASAVPQNRVIRGLIKATQEVTISGAIASQVTEAPFREGDGFNKGDVLINFDCAQLHAEKDAARAALQGHRVAYQSNVKLKRYGAGGSYAVKTARADVQKSKANIRALEARIKYCKVTAPFSGRVVERSVSTHETPALNAPLLRIVNDDDLELRFVVSSRWLAWVRPGMGFEFKVDETGKSYPAELIRIGAVVDPGSQTVRLRGRFKTKPDAVLSGMSGSAVFQPQPVSVSAR